MRFSERRNAKCRGFRTERALEHQRVAREQNAKHSEGHLGQEEGHWTGQIAQGFAFYSGGQQKALSGLEAISFRF